MANQDTDQRNNGRVTKPSWGTVISLLLAMTAGSWALRAEIAAANTKEREAWENRIELGLAVLKATDMVGANFRSAAKVEIDELQLTQDIVVSTLSSFTARLSRIETLLEEIARNR